MEHNIGRDISKFFHGGYAMSGNTSDPSDIVSRIQHTNFSRWIASELAVGRLVKYANTFKTEIDESMTTKITENTFIFYLKISEDK